MTRSKLLKQMTIITARLILSSWYIIWVNYRLSVVMVILQTEPKQQSLECHLRHKIEQKWYFSQIKLITRFSGHTLES